MFNKRNSSVGSAMFNSIFFSAMLVFPALWKFCKWSVRKIVELINQGKAASQPAIPNANTPYQSFQVTQQDTDYPTQP